MNYQPIYKTIVPAGNYDFKITKAVEGETKPKVGKSIRPMLNLTISISHDQNRRATLYWGCLLDSGFLRNVSAGAGLLEKYESGKLEVYDFENKEGKCAVEVEENALYEKKNIIKTFYAKKEDKQNESIEIVDSDIPF